jgi:hypothetical protein
MPGLYDNWKLSNSTAIPQYEGSAGDEFIKVGQYKQGLYDANMNSGIDLGGQANEVSSVFQQDQPLVEELRKETQGKLNDLTQRGDWENFQPEIRQLGQHFANRSREIMAPQLALQEYKKSLDEKELNLTPEQKQGLYAMSVAGYQGLKKNARGQYTGTFNGVTAAKNIDVNKKADEWLKDAVSHKYGTEAETLSSDDGGMWIIKNGQKVDYMKKEDIAGIFAHAAANDQEYQAYKNMMGDLHGFKARGIYDYNSVEGPIKDAALAYSNKTGIPFSKVYEHMVRESTKNDIDNNALAYAIGKYQKNDVTTNSGFKDNPYMLKQYEHNLANPISPFITQGADTKLTDDEKNYGKISKATTDTREQLGVAKTSLDALNTKLNNPNLAPATRTQLTSERDALQKNIQGLETKAQRNEEIMSYSKDLTAQSLGYDDYSSFLQKNSQGLDSAIKKVFPNGLTVKGRKISIDELTEAAAEGRIEAKYSPVTSPGGRPAPLGSTITLKDGTKINLSNGDKGSMLSDAVAGVFQQKGNKLREFETKLAQTHAENVKDFAIQSSNISLNENDRKDIAAHIKSNMDGVRFSKPGQIDAVKAPDNFEVFTIGTTGLGSDVKIKAQELDANNKPTGTFYDVTLPNSNIQSVISRKLGASSDPEARLAADILEPNSGARQLYNTIPGNKLHVGQIQNPGSKDADPIDVFIKVSRNRDKSITYNLVDDGGNVLKSTGNVGEAGMWMDNLQQKQTYSNGNKNSNYNAKSRRIR